MASIIISQRVQHASISYLILNYARFRSRIGDRCFSIEDYQKFVINPTKKSNLQRAVDSLLKNGHLKKMANGRYRYIETKVLTQLDSKYMDSMWKGANLRKNNKAKIELDDIHSKEF
jgi:predicted transcriptional regulator of viral defense system